MSDDPGDMARPTSRNPYAVGSEGPSYPYAVLARAIAELGRLERLEEAHRALRDFAAVAVAEWRQVMLTITQSKSVEFAHLANAQLAHDNLASILDASPGMLLPSPTYKAFAVLLDQIPITAEQATQANALIEKYGPPDEQATSIQIALGHLSLWLETGGKYPRT